MSLPGRIEHLINELAKWRETEHAAQQDVDDTEAHLIACDIKHRDAQRAFNCVSAKVRQVETELNEAISDHTTPVEIVFMDDGSK